MENISDKDWEHHLQVVKEFKIKTLREYHDLYLKIDVYGLHDVFEYHRKVSQEIYGLDPAYFIGLPSFTWSAGLKFTDVELDDITDMDMYMFFEKMKRGGVSVISHKYAQANNKKLPNYDKNKPSTYLIQYDCNNLYGWAMSQMLPYKNFSWVSKYDLPYITKEWIMKYEPKKVSSNEESYIGYALEVDLEYPAHLHEAHNDYPLAPEHLDIPIKDGSKRFIRKLAPNFYDKGKYVVHIENLQYYLQQGLVLKNVHRVVRYEQKEWLKPYIEHNTKLRQQAIKDKDKFKKDYFKLMNNAFYGKTMENVRNRQNIQFCLNKKSFDKWTSSPLFSFQGNNPLVFQEDGLSLVKLLKKLWN